MRNVTIFVGLLLCFLGACQKEQPEDPKNYFESPELSVAFASDPVIDTVTAGLNNRYLFTRLVPVLPDSQQISISTFADVACPEGNCAGSLRFEFQGTFVDSTDFGPGYYAYKSNGIAAGYSGRFSVQNPGPYQNFLLFLNSNIILEGPDTSVTVFFDNFAPLNVQLSAFTGNGLASTISRRIDPLDPIRYPEVGIKMSFVNGGYQLMAQASHGASPLFYQWNTGETSAAIFLDTVPQAAYSVTVVDSTGSTASASIDGIQQLSSFSSATLNFSTTFTPPDFFNKVALQWVDAQGVIWRSDRANQPTGSFFQVVSSTGYDVNENGLPTQKKQVIFQCVLFDDNGQSRPFSGAGIIAVAHQ